jgi:hypothetical protein
VQVVGLTETIFDTGTLQIIGDPDGIERFYAPLKRFGAKLAGDGIYTSTWIAVLPISHLTTFDFFITVPCNFSTPISVYFGETEIKIFPDSFNLGPVSEGSGTCFAGAASNAALQGINWPIIASMLIKLTFLQHFGFLAMFSCRTFTVLGMLVTRALALLTLFES